MHMPEINNFSSQEINTARSVRVLSARTTPAGGAVMFNNMCHHGALGYVRQVENMNMEAPRLGGGT